MRLVGAACAVEAIGLALGMVGKATPGPDTPLLAHTTVAIPDVGLLAAARLAAGDVHAVVVVALRPQLALGGVHPLLVVAAIANTALLRASHANHILLSVANWSRQGSGET